MFQSFGLNPVFCTIKSDDTKAKKNLMYSYKKTLLTLISPLLINNELIIQGTISILFLHNKI